MKAGRGRMTITFLQLKHRRRQSIAIALLQPVKRPNFCAHWNAFNSSMHHEAPSMPQIGSRR